MKFSSHHQTTYSLVHNESMRKICQPLAEELMKYLFHPQRLIRISESYGYDLEEYLEYFM